MSKLLFIIIGLSSYITTTFADGGILGDFDGTNTEKSLRTGDIHTDDIPNIIQGAINFFMGIVGTITIIFIIIGAYKILFGSVTEQSTTQGKDTIMKALGGFALASLSWFIIKLIIDNFSGSI